MFQEHQTLKRPRSHIECWVPSRPVQNSSEKLISTGAQPHQILLIRSGNLLFLQHSSITSHTVFTTTITYKLPLSKPLSHTRFTYTPHKLQDTFPPCLTCTLPPCALRQRRQSKPSSATTPPSSRTTKATAQSASRASPTPPQPAANPAPCAHGAATSSTMLASRPGARRHQRARTAASSCTWSAFTACHFGPGCRSGSMKSSMKSGALARVERKRSRTSLLRSMGGGAGRRRGGRRSWCRGWLVGGSGA